MKAEKLVAKACAEIEFDHLGASVQKDAQDPPTYRFAVSQDLPDQRYRDAYFDVLARLCGLSHTWHVHAPHVFPDDRFFFEGSSDSTTIPGVVHVEFALVRDPEHGGA